MGLTAVTIKSAKGRDRQYKLTDSDGLHLLVLPSGNRYWRMNYRYQGKYKTLAFGVWPEVGLADARAKRDEARRVLAKGIDPAEQAKLDKIAASVAAANTFEAVAEDWYLKAEKEGLAPATLNKIRWLLAFAYPALGKRPIADITAPELLAVLRKFEAGGRHESAKRMR
ncbi:MAG: integrase arm-type DNA-binding domain-containing protein, partial [Alphaproteobacteria bacterium]|nr:integrase arm-type DNA-binding domain-containing protein [Alphaproteobacteria bacterium]